MKAVIAGILISLPIANAYAASNVDVGTTGSSQGTITIHGATSGSGVISVPAVAGSTSFNLPLGNGISGQSLLGDGAGNLVYSSIGSPVEVSWSPGLNLSGVSIPLHFTANAGTVQAIVCRPETLVGGTATIQVWFAPSGTALGSGTRIDTTACNANAGAFTNQVQGVAVSAVPANSWIGIVVPTNAAWATSAGSGGLKVSFVNP